MTSAAAAGIQPVRPFGRPGTEIRYHVAAPAASRRSSSASTVRGWKSGRNCESVVTTEAPRLGALCTATFPHAIGPDPTTRTLASGDSGRAPPTPVVSRAAAAGTAIAARSRRSARAGRRARRSALLLLSAPMNVDGRARELCKPVLPVSREHRLVAGREVTDHPVAADPNA